MTVRTRVKEIVDEIEDSLSGHDLIISILEEVISDEKIEARSNPEDYLFAVDFLRFERDFVKGYRSSCINTIQALKDALCDS